MGLTVCDFCSDPNPAWSFDCPSFTITELKAKSLDAWLACDICASLIQSKSWSALATRGAEKTLTGQMLTRMVGKEEAIRITEEFQNHFRTLATGGFHRL